MKRFVISVALLALAISAFPAFAGVSLNIKCKIAERSVGIPSKINELELITLSTDGDQSTAMRPLLSMDTSGIFVLSLSKGELYLDAEGDEVGAQYYLSLMRLQNRTKTLYFPKLRGKTQDMITLTVSEGFLDSSSYRKNNGRLQKRLPKKLELNYKIKGNKKIKVTCDLLGSE